MVRGSALLCASFFDGKNKPQRVATVNSNCELTGATTWFVQDLKQDRADLPALASLWERVLYDLRGGPGRPGDLQVPGSFYACSHSPLPSEQAATA